MLRPQLPRLILLGLFLLLGGCGKTEQTAHDNRSGGSGGGSSLSTEELALIAPEAVMAGHMHVGDFWRKHGEAIQKRMREVDATIFDTMEAEVGFTMGDIDRILVIVPNTSSEPVPLYVMNKPANQEKIKKGLLKPIKPFAQVGPGGATAPQPAVPEVETLQVNGKTYHRLKQQFSDRALHFMNDRTFFFGPTSAVETMLKLDPKATPGPVAEQLRKEANHQMAVCVALEKLPMSPESPVPVPVRELFKAKIGVMTLDLDDKVKFVARLSFAQADHAAKGAESVKSLVTMAQFAAPTLMKELDYAVVESPDAPDNLRLLLQQSLTALKSVSIDAQGTDLTVKLTVDSDAATIMSANADLIAFLSARAAATFEQVGSSLSNPSGPPSTSTHVRPTIAANMLKIAAALRKYQEQHGSYPPPAIYGKDGTPLLSWRVALLPYLREEELYKQFKLDEPWNSTHNRELRHKMPKVYGGFGMSCYRTFTGGGTAHGGKTGPRPDDFPNNGASTFLVVEADRPADWTRPEGLVAANDKPMPRMGQGINKNFYAIMADGTVRFFKEPPPETTLRKLASKSGGAVDVTNLGEVIKE
jgi:hypothetical protein